MRDRELAGATIVCDCKHLSERNQSYHFLRDISAQIGKNISSNSFRRHWIQFSATLKK
jgi:hypothetical protein